VRCRDALLQSGISASAEAIVRIAVAESGGESSAMDIEEDGAAAVQTPDAFHLQSVFSTHNEALLLLWTWAGDASGVSDAVAATCLEKIESIFSLGVGIPVALRNAEFPWALHWLRMSKLVALAVASLRSSESLHRSVKVLQLAICAWQVHASTEPAAHADSLHLPCRHPNRGSVMNYLEERFGVIDAITCAALLLKERFVAECLMVASTAPWGAQIKEREDFACDSVILPSNVEASLNALKVGGARVAYLAQLSQFLDFIHMAVRCGDTLDIPLNTLTALYKALILTPITADEVDTAVGFLQRVIIKAYDSPTAADTSTTVATSAAHPGAGARAEETLQRSALASRAAVLEMFSSLLCDKNGFLRSKFFSQKAFYTVEKWFRWLNSDLSFGPATSGSAGAAAHKTFRSTGNSEDLVGINVFPQIILHCRSDKVAGAAVKFLTTLPQTLPQWGRHTPSAVAFRQMLLSRCMSDLSASTSAAAGGSDSGVPLVRALLFLDGILEESLAVSGSDVTVHGTIGRGTPVTFRLTSTHKSFSGAFRDVTIFMNETVHDLFVAVAQQLQVEPTRVKIFRLGKELSYRAESTKTIAQLRNIKKEEREHLVVTKHGSPKAATAAARALSKGPSAGVMDVDGPSPVSPPEMGEPAAAPAIEAMDVTDAEKSAADAALAALPAALVLSQTPEYFELLFGLLRTSDAAVCDRLWGLLTRIPTSASVLQRWVELDCSAVTSLLLPVDPTAWSHLSTLLYSLQIIEMLMQPAVSAADLEDQYRFIQNIDHALLRTWVQRFVEKDGLRALCRAFEWVQSALLAFLKSASPLRPRQTLRRS
jgi:hypothetical protein